MNFKKTFAEKSDDLKRFLSLHIQFGSQTKYCNVCNWKGAHFYKGQTCPKCKSFARTRLIPFSIEHFNLLNAKCVLHIAPSKSEYNILEKYFKESNYDCLDMISHDHINIQHDLTKPGLKEKYYDLAIAWHVLEHIPEDITAIKNIYNSLNKNGKFLVSVPIFPTGNLVTEEEMKHDSSFYLSKYGHHDHCRACGLDYFKRFEKVGFKTEELNVSNLDGQTISKLALRKDHVVWLFTK